jgi:succinate-semialdehyde dehydrogenase/glutarate-semialdehyde dehydrogenase
MRSVNPATEQIIAEYPMHDEATLGRLVDRAAAAAGHWRNAPFDDRRRPLHNAAEVLRDNRRLYSELMTAEMGKPIAQAEAEIDQCALACEHFAEHGAKYVAPQNHPSDASRSFVRFDPLGVVLAIMPWNFPFWQCFRFAAPALIAGNVGLLKHADNVPGCALAIEKIFTDAGFPAGCFTTLMISNERVDQLIADPAIAAVTLTGSERAGRIVGAAAGQALKKIVLELGGSDPFIVLKDAPIEETAQAAAAARCLNSGQSCIAAKRFIVERPILARFTEAFIRALESIPTGDPMDRAQRMGPLARADLRDRLADQVQRSLSAGARVLTGGYPLKQKGFYYAPTLLADVAPGMPAFDEELFGPVAALIAADDADHAVRLANQTPFGLGASIWTTDEHLAEQLAARIDAGNVFINGPVKSDPRLPFGGVKHSGYGRELSQFGLREFVNVKTVWVK